jgi:hypothetical protein
MNRTAYGCVTIALLILGIPLTLIGLVVSGIVLLSGAWTLGYMYPVLVISIPMFVLGVLALFFQRSMKSNDPLRS